MQFWTCAATRYGFVGSWAGGNSEPMRAGDAGLRVFNRRRTGRNPMSPLDESRGTMQSDNRVPLTLTLSQREREQLWAAPDYSYHGEHFPARPSVHPLPL